MPDDDDLKRQFDDEGARLDIPEIDPRMVGRRAALRRRVRMASQAGGVAAVVVAVLVLTNVVRTDPGKVEIVQPASPHTDPPATPGVSPPPAPKPSPSGTQSRLRAATATPERRSDPAISSDGRFVAYAAGRVFVLDRETGKRAVVSISESGAAVEGSQPQVSADGRYVAFVARSGVVYRRDRVENRTAAASVTTSGAAINAGSEDQSISMSADGRFIAFSTSKRLLEDDTNSVEDVVLRDMTENKTILVSLATTGEVADRRSIYADVSTDGRAVAFQSYATNLTPGPDPMCGTASCPQVFVHDLENRTTSLVSLAPNGEPADRGGRHPTISETGRWVAFDSAAGNLGSENPDASSHDVFLYDRETGVIREMSGSHEICNCTFPYISNDGSLIAYGTPALGLWLYDASVGAERRIASYGRGSVGFDRGGRLVVYRASNGTIMILDRSTGKKVGLP